MPQSTTPASTIIDGRPIAVAPLETVNFKRLEAGEPAEAEKLLRAAQSPGFFYLDLKDVADGKCVEMVKMLYKVVQYYFDRPQEAKMVDFRDNVEKGYKTYGFAETFEIPRDEPTIPELLEPCSPLFTQLITTCHRVSKTLLAVLSSGLNVQLERYHLDTSPSDSALKIESMPLLEKLEDMPPSEHTDMGTLTLLFCEQYTTEVRMSGREDWAFVKPQEGCAVVNVADSLQTMTKGRLTSSLHRLGQPVAGSGERVCALYYLRPGGSSSSDESAAGSA